MSRVAAAAAALALTVGALAGAPAASAAPSAAASAVTVSSDVASYYANIHTDASTVYYPTTGTGKLPVALLLQGADVDRDEYATYARTVASYGFVVVVPNHWRLVFVDYGLFSHQGQAIQTAIWAHVEMSTRSVRCATGSTPGRSPCSATPSGRPPACTPCRQLPDPSAGSAATSARRN